MRRKEGRKRGSKAGSIAYREWVNEWVRVSWQWWDKSVGLEFLNIFVETPLGWLSQLTHHHRHTTAAAAAAAFLPSPFLCSSIQSNECLPYVCVKTLQYHSCMCYFIYICLSSISSVSACLSVCLWIKERMFSSLWKNVISSNWHQI